VYLGGTPRRETDEEEEAEVGVMQVQIQECQSYQKLEAARDRSPPEPLDGA
jgi:hypothetical protein